MCDIIISVSNSCKKYDICEILTLIRSIFLMGTRGLRPGKPWEPDSIAKSVGAAGGLSLNNRFL